MAPYSTYSSLASPTTSVRDDIIYIDTTPSTAHTPSPRTPSSVSTISALSPSSVGSGNWSNMSHTSRSRAVTELDVEQIVRHPAYYIPSGDVVFMVRCNLSSFSSSLWLVHHIYSHNNRRELSFSVFIAISSFASL